MRGLLPFPLILVLSPFPYPPDYSIFKTEADMTARFDTKGVSESVVLTFDFSPDLSSETLVVISSVTVTVGSAGAGCRGAWFCRPQPECDHHFHYRPRVGGGGIRERQYIPCQYRE